MDMQDNAIYRVWIHFIPISLYPRREEKTIGSDLVSNQGPLASQATALTPRPCLLSNEVGYIEKSHRVAVTAWLIQELEN